VILVFSQNFYITSGVLNRFSFSIELYTLCTALPAIIKVLGEESSKIIANLEQAEERK
jgi:hypothetical protein